MDTWARSRCPAAPGKAFDLLQTMISLYDNGRGRVSLCPDISRYNLVLKACELAPRKEVEGGDSDVATDHRTALNVAIQTFGQVQSNAFGVIPSHATYSYMIAICNKHMSKRDPRRDKMIEKLFEQCCKDGQLSSLVFKRFQECASPALLNQMASQYGTSPSSYEEYPLTFKRNVSRQLTNTQSYSRVPSNY